jgi:hypothetical protein
MKLLLQVIDDLITLRSPLKIRDPFELAQSMAQWVFLLLLSLVLTAVLIALVGQ